jgi:hypothetical protein
MLYVLCTTDDWNSRTLRKIYILVMFFLRMCVKHGTEVKNKLHPFPIQGIWLGTFFLEL